ncbi:DUF6531 domain-containing protein [Streptomyces sp. NPDC090022]|uniref:DUF6531 domain-containing protein n=1 Tax=Streptomyces sp. NPDC090022 TaxID=3365920 RepID=UPI0037F50503
MAITVPDWADTLLDLVGVNWPNVDEDAYRDMADALREFAEDLADDGQLANNHFARLLSSGEGESIKALGEHWNTVKGKHLKDIVSAARTIAGALDMAAGAIEAMKVKAVAELGLLAAQTGLAMALIPVTGGLSALLGAGAIAFTKKQLLKLLTEAAEEAVALIVAAMTEPAVAALEGMAADLVVQLGAVAIGLQDGVDVDQTKQAGKDGFNDGVQSGKESLNLASAGGSGGGGGGSGLSDLFIDHDEHDRAHGKLSGVSTNIHGRTTSKLTKAKTAHGRTRGRDSIAQAIDPVADKAVAALMKATKQVGDHVGKTLPKAVKQISTDHKNNDDDLAARLARAKAKDAKEGKGGGGSGGSGRPGGKPNGPGGHKKPDDLNKAKDETRRNSIPEKDTHCEGDPVDVVTGEMILTHTDLTLPGTLPLVLRRTHLSAYRYGRWFGRSWASTLDERIELDPVGGGATWAREDGSVLVYPRLPLPGGEPVLPVEGPRLALAHGGSYEDQTTYTVTDVRAGLTRAFTGSPYQASPAYWLTSIEDRHENRIAFSRASDGSPTAVTHSGGYTVQTLTRDERIASLAVRGPDGPVTVMTYGYDGRGNLAAITNSSGRALRLTYDAADRITSWTDRNDSTFHYAYDTAGRVVRTTGPDGFLTAAFAYDPVARVNRYTDATGATKVFHYNEHLQIVAETDPLGHTVHSQWDAYDRLVARSDALGRTTTYTYDAHGNLVRIVHPDGTTAVVEYNALHQMTSVTGPDGATYRQEYDERGNPTAFLRPDGTATRLTHDASGHLTGVGDQLGPKDLLRVDAAGLPRAVRDQRGGVTHYERDAFGRAVRITDGQGRTTELEWTVEGHLARRIDPDGSEQSWTYDGEGNCLVHTDAAGGRTRYEYTHFDLLAARTTPGGARHTFGYDGELRLTEVVGPQGLTWTYTYDAAGRLTGETDFDGRTLGYAHDALGRLTARTNGLGETIRFERDAAGRVVTRDAAGAVTRFRHDTTGRLVHAAGPDAELTWEYDGSGRVVRETTNGRATAFAYDVTGRRVRRTTPSGAVSSWEYPATGRAAHLDASGHRVTFEFDAEGHETRRRIGDALTIEHAYDDLGRLTGQLVRGPGERTVQERSYTYRPDGRLAALGDRLAGARAFDTSREGRVTGVSGANWTERYAYDEAGNQTQALWPGEDAATGPREYTGTRLGRAGSVRYEYDAQGRVVLRQKTRLSRRPDTWRYAWDAEDRLVGVTTPDGTRWRYRYDPLGRRIAKQRLSPDGSEAVVEQVDFTWDGDVLCEQRSGAPGSPEAIALTWDHDGFKPVAQTERRLLDQGEVDRRFFAIVTDLVGTPRELVDERGEIAWRTRATLWGTTTWNRDATAYTPLRFPGQYFDPESGLHYNHHRHYDPESGRYVSPDPLGLVPAPNAFTYVDDPTTWVDPLGLSGCPHKGDDKPKHHVVLGVNSDGKHSDDLAKWLREQGGDGAGAHTYNGKPYDGILQGGPWWMLNVKAGISDREGTRLSIILDGMFGADGKPMKVDTPERIAEAFQQAAAHGNNFSLGKQKDWPTPGNGTAWEMSQVALAVRQYEGTVDDPDFDTPAGRGWHEIDWYTRDGDGFRKIEGVDRPDISILDPASEENRPKETRRRR